MQPNVLNIFVANRVAEIQELRQSVQWNHVPTKLNPADPVSRGVMPGELQNNNIWWHGPAFLRQLSSSWPHQVLQIAELPEVKTTKVTF